MKKILNILLLILVFSSCEFQEDEGEVVAQAYDYKLYRSDLELLIPQDVSYEDSVDMAKDYINQWTRQHAILYKANNNTLNLENDIKEINNKVEEYRNSLIIYNYTKRLIEQKLDTIVDYDEVEAYHKENQKEFLLKEDILQVSYVKLPVNSKNIGQVRKLLKSNDAEDIEKVRHIAQDKAANHFLDENVWILLDDFLKEVPIDAIKQKQYLIKDKYFEIKDSVYTYMVKVNNIRKQDDLSPLSFEFDRIQSIIINIRKMELIERMKNDVYMESQKKGAIKIAAEKKLKENNNEKK